MSEPFSPARPLMDEDSGGAISAFVPILVLGLVMLAWFGFQSSQLRAERTAMHDVIANQEKQVQDSKKLRDALDAVARGTAQLANAGNPNAKLVVDELKRRGITITPDQPAATTTPPPVSK